jgi:curved DNA-binding protein CbpA
MTLYDLLGACPSDDSHELKKAFRSAVRANHPDLHPDDPDAPGRLSGIVRAYAILRDPQERAAYDAALEHERNLLRHKPRRSVRSALHNVIYEAVAMAVLVVALSGGYALLANVLGGDGVNAVSVTPREPTKIVAVQPAPPTNITVREEPQSGPAVPTSPTVTLSAALPGSKKAPATADDMSSLPTKEVVKPADHSGRPTDQALAKRIDDSFVTRHEPMSPDQRQNPGRIPNAAPSARLSSLQNENAAKSSSPDRVITDQKHRPEDARSSDARVPKLSMHDKPGAVATAQPPGHAPVKQALSESKGTPACADSQSCSGKSLVLRGVGP